MKNLLNALIAIIAISFSSMSSAYIISGGAYNGTNVGSLDTLLGISNALPNSNPTSEEHFLNTFINPDATFDARSNSNIPYFKTNTNFIFAVQLLNAPDYFVLKNATFWAAYANTGNLGWAVFDVRALPARMNLGKNGKAGTMSHESEFGVRHDVTEPSTLLLLSLGLLGLFAVRRRQI